MKKLKIFIPILILFVSIDYAMSQSGDGPIWVSGEVASIFQDKDGAIFSLNLAGGETYNISATSEIVEGLKIGDYVTVEVNRGWAELIEKGDIKAGTTPKTDNQKTAPQWIAGKLIAINEGSEESLLSVKLSNDKTFNVSASNDLISNVKVGDYITVKILKGCAQSITKK